MNGRIVDPTDYAYRNTAQYKAAVAAEVAKQARLSAAHLRPYMHDPVAFVHDMFIWGDNERPTAYQEDIMAGLVENGRAAVRGPHGLGKTALAGWVILWFALTRDGLDWKIPTTAGSWRQLTKFLWPEIAKWARRLDWKKLKRAPFDGRSEMQAQNLKLGTGEASAIAARNYELIEGAHADHILYVFDEAKAIQDGTFDAAEGAFSGAGTDTEGEAYALACSTPGETVGRFYEIHRRAPGYEDWWVRHVRLEECIRAGRVSQSWADQRKKQWGATSQVYKNRVLGEFAGAPTDGVISLEHIEKANELWLEWQEAGGVGRYLATSADVGSGNKESDLSSIVDVYDQPEGVDIGDSRGALLFGEVSDYAGEDTMALTGRLVARLDRGRRLYGSGLVIIDSNGIGLGVLNRGHELGRNFIGFVAQAGTDLTDESEERGFVDLRAAAWWGLREILDPANGYWVALPPDDLLTGELTAPKYRNMSGGKIRVESKKDVRLRLRRSTDHADPIVQIAYYYKSGTLGTLGGTVDDADGGGTVSDEDEFEARWT